MNMTRKFVYLFMTVPETIALSAGLLAIGITIGWLGTTISSPDKEDKKVGEA